MNTAYKIRKFGRTLVVTLPSDLLRAVSLGEGDMVSFHLTPQDLIFIKRANQDAESARIRRYCGGCAAEITVADIQNKRCTQCGKRSNN